MSKFAPIVLLEDDADDQIMVKDAILEAGFDNEILLLSQASEALRYLKDTSIRPFLILCDINLPGTSGLEFRRELLKDPALAKKRVPFIFLSTSDYVGHVKEAYELVVQGYFVKSDKYSQMIHDLGMICNYWSRCQHPYGLTC
jgi:CheY-like chemotaxis protein